MIDVLDRHTWMLLRWVAVMGGEQQSILSGDRVPNDLRSIVAVPWRSGHVPAAIGPARHYLLALEHSWYASIPLLVQIDC